MIKYFFVFLLVISMVNSQDLNNYESITVESKINSKLNIDYKEDNYKLDYVIANLTFFPINNEFQNSSYDLISIPEAKIGISKNSIYYKWENTGDDELNYGLNVKIHSKTNFKKIDKKIKFPIDVVPELEDYTKESETVTSKDPEIIKKAAELAQGEDDLYAVVHKIGSWTKENINYSLETLTAEVSQNSSWVLENKKGVCDELTSLFVAMLRSINIPARFVSGQAYTNVINGFGNHAWAEVYFPGHGWVPFDPTYGQLGYVDSTHISMKDSIDVKESSVNYAWRSYGVEISSSNLDIKSKEISKGGLYKENIKIDLSLLKNEVGPKSYVPLEIKIENLNDYYLPLTLDVIKAPKKLINLEKNVLLEPNGIKKVYFVIEIPDDLDNGFIYTSSIEIKDSFNNYYTNEVKFGREYEVYNLEDAQLRLKELENEQDKVYSANVNAECSKDKGFYYKYENINLTCYVRNSGNINLKDLNLCYLNKCKYLNVNIGGEEIFHAELKAEEADKELKISIGNDEVSKTLFLDLNVLKTPNIAIKNLRYPEIVDYNNEYKINFNLNSDSEAKNVLIKLGDKELFNIEALKGENDFIVEVKGRDFYNKELDLSVEYKDKNNKLYSLKNPIDIEVENIPFYIKYSLLIAIIILILIVSMIFRRKLLH